MADYDEWENFYREHAMKDSAKYIGNKQEELVNSILNFKSSLKDL